MEEKLYVIFDPTGLNLYGEGLDVLLLIVSADQIVRDRGRVVDFDHFFIDCLHEMHYTVDPGQPADIRMEKVYEDYSYITIESEQHGTLRLKGTDYTYVPPSHYKFRRKLIESIPSGNNIGSWLLEHHFGIPNMPGFMLFGTELER